MRQAHPLALYARPDSIWAQLEKAKAHVLFAPRVSSALLVGPKIYAPVHNVRKDGLLEELEHLHALCVLRDTAPAIKFLKSEVVAVLRGISLWIRDGARSLRSLTSALLS